VAPEDRPFLCILHDDGSVQIDHVACFGCSSCPGIFDRVADALVGIYHNLKWVDDFVFFQYPSPSPHDVLFYEFDASLLLPALDGRGRLRIFSRLSSCGTLTRKLCT
jgi:hypothetical protein